MRHLPRALGVLGATLLLVSCVSSDSSTGPGDAADPAGVVIQPAVVPTAADASALPINRIRAVTSLWPSNLVLADTTIVVDPTAAEWDLTLDVRLRESPAIGHVFLYLINQADSARIQYSGKTDTMTLVRNQVSESGDVLLVRGPLSNLFVTGVAITGPGTVVERRTLALAAEVETTSTSSQLPVVFWTSLDTTVVTVDGSEAFGVRTGSALVVATAGAYSDTASVTVTTAPVGSVEVTPAAAQVVIGTTAALAATVRADDGVVLTDRPVRWSSSAPAIASVDSLTGVVTAVELGSATISATSESVTGTATVTVVPVPVDSVLVSPDSADVDAGATIAFGAQTFDADGNELDGRVVTWTTGNPSIATVDPSTGVVRGVAAGVTTVTATSEGMSDQATVVVLPPPGGPGGVNTWIATGGTWSTSANWSLGRVPIPGDTVQLTQGVDYLVTLDVDATIERLVIGGTGDVITLAVGDRTLTVTDTGPEGGIELLPLGAMQVTNGSVSAQALVNSGSIRVTGTASLQAATFVNNATLFVANPAILTVDHPVSLDFQTSGTVTIEDGAAMLVGPGSTKNFSYLGGSIDGPGTLVFQELVSVLLYSELSVDGPQVIFQGAESVAVDANRLTIGPSSSLTLLSETEFASTTTVLVVQGILYATGPNTYTNDSLYVEAGATVVVDGSDGPTSLVTVDVLNSGDIVLMGAFDAYFGTQTNGRRVTNQPGGNVYATPGGPRHLLGAWTNEGLVSIGAPTDLTRRTLGGIPATAVHVNSGSVELDGGSLRVELGATGSSFTNTGTLSVSATDTLTLENLSSASVAFGQAGSVVGEGAIRLSGSPTVSSAGTIAPGFSPGTLTWLGDLPMTATSTLAIELDGTTAGSFDQLVVSGTAAVDGALVVDTVPGFTPSPGDRFPILVFGQRGPGAVFESVTFPTVAGIAFDTVWAEAGSVDTLFIEASTGSASPVNRWIDPAGGNWSDTGNWSLGVVPAPGDSAVIDEPGTYNVLLDVGATVDHLAVGGPGAQVFFQHSANTLTVAQSLSVAAASSYALGGTGVLAGAHVGTFDGDMLWSSGTWTGTATTTLRSDGNVFSGSSKTLNARSIVNEGTLAWTGGLISPSNGSTFLNAAGATWFIRGDNTTYSFGSGVSITNEGSMVRDTGTGFAAISADFANDGTFEIQTGDMRLNGNGTHSGFFIVAPGALFTVSSGVHDFAGSISGAGDMIWTGGVSNVSGSFLMPAIIASQSVQFSGTLAPLDSIVKTGPNLLGFTTADTVRAGLWKVNTTNGNITGSSNLLVLDSLEWTAGTIQGNPGTSITIAPTAGVGLVGTDSKTLGVRSMNVGGNAVWTGGNLALQSGAALNVLASGTFDIRGDLLMQGTSLESIDNAGTFVRSTTTGTAATDIPFSNTGTLDVQTGTLQLVGTVTNTGTVQVGTSAVLDLDAPSTHAAAAAMQGTGTVDVEDMIGGDLSGDIAPAGAGANGTFTWISDYDPSSSHRLLIELAGPAPGQYDAFNITGSATASFAGTLEVSLIDGYVPGAGDTIPIVTFDARAGTFESVVLPSFAGVELDTLWTADVNGLADVDTLYVVAKPFPLLFTSDRGGATGFDIWLQSANGTAVTQLTSGVDDETGGRFSPDGNRIAFTRDNGSSSSMWIMFSDGTGETQVTGGGTNDSQPDWSPDGNLLVYRSNDGNSDDIWITDTEGSNPFGIAVDQFINDWQPVWNPANENQIAFVTDRQGNQDIWVMEANGANPTEVTTDGADDYDPQWSPDGQQIVFVSERDGDPEIFLMDANGGNQVQLTNNTANDWAPVWGPDDRIYFASDLSGNFEIWVMDKDGGNATQLTSNAATDDMPDVRD